MMRSKTREIRLYSIDDLIGLLASYVANKPIDRSTRPFRAIASAFMTFSGVAHGKDVRWHSARIINALVRYGYPMLLDNPERIAFLASTDTAGMPPIFQASIPIVTCECVRQVSELDASASSLVGGVFWMRCVIIAIVLASFFSVLSAILTVILTLNINSACSVFVSLLFVSAVAFSIICAKTLQAPRAYTKPSILVDTKEFRSREVFIAAFRAALEKSELLHSVSLSLYLIWVLADGEIRRLFGSYPSQHLYYSTGWGKTP